MTYRYKTEMTCSSEITFDLDGDVVTNIVFTGGCNGNLKAISKILDGWTVDRIVEKLEGNRAVKAAYENSKSTTD